MNIILHWREIDLLSKNNEITMEKNIFANIKY